MPSPQPYSPDNPYQAPVLPDPAPAAPSPLPTQGPQIDGHVKTSGAIATMADSILRGFMNGRAIGQAQQVMKLKKKTDDLQNSYNQDAVRLYQLHQAGADVSTDPEAKKQYADAESSVRGSWGALMDFYGKHITPPDTGKKKGKAKEAEGGILGALQGKDPIQQSQAWYALAQKAGPPVFGQIAVGKAQRQSPQGQAQTTHDTNTLTHEQAQATYNKYAGKTEEEMAALPQEEQAAFNNARAVLMPPGGTKGTTRLYVSPDGKSKEWYIPGQEPKDWNATGTGTAAKPVRAWRKMPDGKFVSELLDPETNQPIAGTENGSIAPPASLSGRISQGFHYWVDDDNKLHQTPETRTSTPTAGAEGGAAPQQATPVASQKPPAPSPASAAATPPAPTPPAASVAARPPARSPQATAPKSTNVPRGTHDTILGQVRSPEETTAKKLADTRETAFHEAIDHAKHPTPTGDKAIVFDWVRSQVAGAGRMTNTEIQQAYSAGTLEQQAATYLKKATDGTMDDTIRKNMINDIGISAREARKQANSYKKSPADGISDDASDLSKYKFTQTRPNDGFTIGSADGVHWVDVKTGKPYTQ